MADAADSYERLKAGIDRALETGKNQLLTRNGTVLGAFIPLSLGEYASKLLVANPDDAARLAVLLEREGSAQVPPDDDLPDVSMTWAELRASQEPQG